MELYQSFKENMHYILKRSKMNTWKPILTPMEERLQLTKEETSELVVLSEQVNGKFKVLNSYHI